MVSNQQQFQWTWYAVKRIPFKNKVLVLQDVGFGHSLLEERCRFLYNFTDPIHNFDLPFDFQLQSFNYSSLNCSLEVHIISHTLFPVLYDSVPFKDYNLYYWNESAAYQSEAVHQPNCRAGKPNLFECVLSFGASDGSLTLLLLVLLHYVELREDCFSCQETGKSNGSKNGSVSSSCYCRNSCNKSKDRLSQKIWICWNYVLRC